METHQEGYSAQAALDDVADVKVRTAQHTQVSAPWWLILSISATWPLLGLANMFDGWLGIAITLGVMAAGFATVVVLNTRLERRGVKLSFSESFKKMPWAYVALGVIGLSSLAMMPLTDIYDWPRWYGLVVGIVAGLLTFWLTLWVSRRTEAELAMLTARANGAQ